jgi:hypothetical protein
LPGIAGSIFRPGLIGRTLRRGQRQSGCAAEEVALLGRELTLETVRLDDPLTLIGRHSAQIANGCTQFLPAFGRKFLKLRKQLPGLPLLVRRQVFPGFHALQDAVLLLWWEAAEALQLSTQHLLPSGRKAAELGIVFQRFLLLIGGKIPVAAQPLPGMIALHDLTRRNLGAYGLAFFTPLNAFGAAGLGRTRRDGTTQHEARSRGRHFRRDGLEF